jgi:hypothetical protein
VLQAVPEKAAWKSGRSAACPYLEIRRQSQALPPSLAVTRRIPAPLFNLGAFRPGAKAGGPGRMPHIAPD